MACPFPEPDRPVRMMKGGKPLALFILVIVWRRRDRQHALAQGVLEPLSELARSVMAAHAQQLVARGHLDEDCDAASRRDGHADQGHAQAEDVEELVVEP